jgi:hypothetical protein
MKDRIEQWIQEQPQPPGVLAMAVSFPDKSFILRCLGLNISEDCVKNSIRCAEDTFEVTNLQRIPCTQLRWVYEKIIFYFVKRPDKLIIGVAINKEFETNGSLQIANMLREFISVGQ